MYRAKSMYKLIKIGYQFACDPHTPLWMS